MDRHNDALFSDKSDLYQRARPDYPNQLFEYLAGLCQHHERAWDCACGNGQAAVGIAEWFTHVDATDVSAEQLRKASTKDNIQYAKCHAENTPFSANHFDLICVAQALHWFDYERFWPEVRRVIKPGGVFAAWGYNWPHWGKELGPIIERTLINVIEPYFASNNALLWNHYRDLSFPFTPIKTPSFSMYVKYDLDQLFDFMHSTSAVRHLMRLQGEDFFKRAYQQVGHVWGDPKFRRRFELDFVLIVGRFD